MPFMTERYMSSTLLFGDIALYDGSVFPEQTLSRPYRMVPQLFDHFVVYMLHDIFQVNTAEEYKPGRALFTASLRNYTSHMSL